MTSHSSFESAGSCAALQGVSHNFWRMGSEVCSEFPKFATNLEICLRSCQWSCELRGEVRKFVQKFGTKFGIEFHWSSEHSYELFNPARKSHLNNRSGENCRPLTGRQRTNTNWKISVWKLRNRLRVSSSVYQFPLFRKGEHLGWQGYFISNSSCDISKSFRSKRRIFDKHIQLVLLCFGEVLRAVEVHVNWFTARILKNS